MRIILFLLLSMAFASCQFQGDGNEQNVEQIQAGGDGGHSNLNEANNAPLDIIDTAVLNGSFTILAQALDVAGLTPALKADGPFTVFAPTDTAFLNLPVGVLNGLLANPAELRKVLLYHVVSGRIDSGQVIQLTSAETLEGNKLKISTAGGVMVNTSNVVIVDVQASNGIIHVIDEVLIPPTNVYDTLAADPQFSTLVTGIDVSGLKEVLKALGPVTFFAPTNDAFNALPAGVLTSLINDPPALRQIILFHLVGAEVLSGDIVFNVGVPSLKEGSDLTFTAGGTGVGVRVESSSIEAVDKFATNGVIHIIDAVLIP